MALLLSDTIRATSGSCVEELFDDVQEARVIRVCANSDPRAAYDMGPTLYRATG